MLDNRTTNLSAQLFLDLNDVAICSFPDFFSVQRQKLLNSEDNEKIHISNRGPKNFGKSSTLFEKTHLQMKWEIRKVVYFFLLKTPQNLYSFD